MSLPLILVRLVENGWKENTFEKPFRYIYFHYGEMRETSSDYDYDYSCKFKKLTEISDEEIPFKYKEPLSIVTEEELKADQTRLEDEEKAWREEVRKVHKSRNYEEMKKLGYRFSEIRNYKAAT